MIPPCSTIRVCRTCGEAINEARPAMNDNPNMCRLCEVLSWTLALPEEPLLDKMKQDMKLIFPASRLPEKKP